MTEQKRVNSFAYGAFVMLIAESFFQTRIVPWLIVCGVGMIVHSVFVMWREKREKEVPRG